MRESDVDQVFLTFNLISLCIIEFKFIITCEELIKLLIKKSLFYKNYMWTCN
jgi:hypothetical protein